MRVKRLLSVFLSCVCLAVCYVHNVCYSLWLRKSLTPDNRTKTFRPSICLSLCSKYLNSKSEKLPTFHVLGKCVNHNSHIRNPIRISCYVNEGMNIGLLSVFSWVEILRDFAHLVCHLLTVWIFHRFCAADGLTKYRNTSAFWVIRPCFRCATFFRPVPA